MNLNKIARQYLADQMTLALPADPAEWYQCQAFLACSRPHGRKPWWLWGD